MKTIMLAWLIFDGQVVPESLTLASFATMELCETTGQELLEVLDGVKSVTKAGYVCAIEGVNT